MCTGNCPSFAGKMGSNALEMIFVSQKNGNGIEI